MAASLFKKPGAFLPATMSLPSRTTCLVRRRALEQSRPDTERAGVTFVNPLMIRRVTIVSVADVRR